jgi:hypothetical protein
MKVIQILFAPQNNTWQGKLLGLGDDGVVYFDNNGKWESLGMEQPSVRPARGHLKP